MAAALEGDDLAAARSAVGRIVGRDVQALDARQVAGAATESVLENGSDAVFAALFWGLLLGAPGAVLYRLANTLDAMWGYRTPRYLGFGWAAARIDDGLNWLPAHGRTHLRRARRHGLRAALLACAGHALEKPQCRTGDGGGSGRAAGRARWRSAVPRPMAAAAPCSARAPRPMPAACVAL